MDNDNDDDDDGYHVSGKYQYTCLAGLNAITNLYVQTDRTGSDRQTGEIREILSISYDYCELNELRLQFTIA